MSSEVAEYMPVLREFVDAVNDRDPDVMQACFVFTPPGTLAVLCAGWVGELLNEADEVREELAGLRARLSEVPADVVGAYRAQKARAERAERRVAELRELIYREAAGRPAGGGKLVA